jgi:hypothetical protein
MDYLKYIKYKKKYLKFKYQIGGTTNEETIERINSGESKFKIQYGGSKIRINDLKNPNFLKYIDDKRKEYFDRDHQVRGYHNFITK